MKSASKDSYWYRRDDNGFTPKSTIMHKKKLVRYMRKDKFGIWICSWSGERKIMLDKMSENLQCRYAMNKITQFFFFLGGGRLC